MCGDEPQLSAVAAATRAFPVCAGMSPTDYRLRARDEMFPASAGMSLTRTHSVKVTVSVPCMSGDKKRHRAVRSSICMLAERDWCVPR